ncbi:hypothetical protein GCM10023208_34190 [Erythrobacter westpacificensis]|uniref:WG repeat-containing protein n=1 Tax=Erythrobacter westpacificensis TaxID=1055231 RepID=A0ABP9KUD8_9SPHN
MKLHHPLTRLPYIRLEDGSVQVGDKEHGIGIFDRHGNWISGERKQADGMLCLYVSDAYLQPYNREFDHDQKDDHS